LWLKFGSDKEGYDVLQQLIEGAKYTTLSILPTVYKGIMKLLKGITESFYLRTTIHLYLCTKKVSAGETISEAFSTTNEWGGLIAKNFYLIQTYPWLILAPVTGFALYTP
jgi:ABC-type dipeptide/oligopeptide/nickel transport system permease subunit